MISLSGSALRAQLKVFGHGALGLLVERHQPFLAAFAAHHQHALVAACGGSRKRHQFRHAQAGRIDDFQKAKQSRGAQALQRAAASALSLLARAVLSSASTSAIESTFGSERAALWPFEHRGGIVAAFSLRVEETIKLAHRRKPARQR